MAIELIKLRPFRFAVGTLLGRGGLATDSVAAERTRKCLACQHLRADKVKCNLCGCYIEVKVRYAGSTCPAGVWSENVTE